MIRTVLTLHAGPARLNEILDISREEKILQSSLENSGALASEVSVAAHGSGEVMVTALWPDEAAYEVWLKHPSRRDSAPRLAPLLGGATKVAAGRIFVVDHAVDKAIENHSASSRSL